MRTVHKVCTMLLGWEALHRNTEERKCKECPAWRADTERGKYKNGCRLAAEEVVNIVRTGNPWGKRHCVWPRPAKPVVPVSAERLIERAPKLKSKGTNRGSAARVVTGDGSAEAARKKPRKGNHGRSTT